jgi:O-antigen ligase
MSEHANRVIAFRDGVPYLLAQAGWFTLLLPLATVLLSVVLSPASNWVVATAVAGFCILAIARPDAALLVTTALLGFGIILAHLADVPPLRVTEVLVIATLAGCFVRALARDSPIRRALTGRLSIPVVLLAMVAIASTAVWLRVDQFESEYASTYILKLFRFASHDYFVQPRDFWLVVSTAAVLEGLALYVVAASCCQVDPTFSARALRMLALGGAALAVMSVVRLAEIVLRSPGIIDVLRETYGGLRISPQIPDYIAAGSYFALCWLVALGIAMASAPRGWVWLAAGLPLILGLYLTGSRSVIVAAFAGLVVLIGTVVRRKATGVRLVVVVAIIAVVGMVAGYSRVVGRDMAGENARQSLVIRSELLRAGLRVIATRPLFGVGLDRFYLSAGAVATPELNALWPGRKNPHNDFIRVGAELGLVGLALFLWILTASATRIWRALRRTGDVRLAGLSGGLVAFLVTSLFSNPLMLREVSYLFWIALGLAVGHSAGLHASSDLPAPATSASGKLAGQAFRFRWASAAVVAGLLVFSIPFRARQEIATVNVAGVSYGLYDWATEDGVRWRWSGPRATLFVDGRARAIEVPLSGNLPSGNPQNVDVLIDGQLVNRLAVGPEWQRLRALLPDAPSSRPRRIDLLVSPTWVRADVIHRSKDRRVLGVRVGEIKVTMAPGDRR